MLNERQIVIQAYADCAKKWQVTPELCIVKDFPEEFAILGKWQVGIYVPEEQRIYIKPSICKTPAQLKTAIKHEMRHAWQDSQGWSFCTDGSIPYFLRKEELDAYYYSAGPTLVVSVLVGYAVGLAFRKLVLKK